VPLANQYSPASGSLLVTGDGGVTWRRYTTPRLVALQFVNDREGWAMGYRAGQGAQDLLHTTDGGATWNRTSLPSAPGGRARS